jgi:uncharacterized protein YdhG (YjbR/CyaY superfamily)
VDYKACEYLSKLQKYYIAVVKPCIEDSIWDNITICYVNNEKSVRVRQSSQMGVDMEVFAEYLSSIDNLQNRERVEEVLSWVLKKFPNLIPKIAWNQPMFTDHGTFIIGFSTAKHHMAVAPEKAGINKFSEDIVQAGYDHTKELIRIRWDGPVDYSLLEKIIEFNILDKAECATFWRK